MISRKTANSINGRIAFLAISIIINSFFNASRFYTDGERHLDGLRGQS